MSVENISQDLRGTCTICGWVMYYDGGTDTWYHRETGMQSCIAAAIRVNKNER